MIVNSTDMTTTGDNSPGIVGTSADGFVQITSGTVDTSGANSPGIYADAFADAEVTSTSVTTTSPTISAGILVQAQTGYATIGSGTVGTGGGVSPGIAVAAFGDIDITSSSVTTTGDRQPRHRRLFDDRRRRHHSAAMSAPPGDGSIGIYANAGTDVVVTSTGTVDHHRRRRAGHLRLSPLPATSPSPAPSSTTGGDSAPGIFAEAADDAVDRQHLGHHRGRIQPRHRGRSLAAMSTSTSGSVATDGRRQRRYHRLRLRPGHRRSRPGHHRRPQLAGIIASQGCGCAPEDAPDGAMASHGVGPGVVITSTDMTTTGDNSPGIVGTSAAGFVDITSGTVTTSGANSDGIVADAFTDVEIGERHGRHLRQRQHRHRRLCRDRLHRHRQRHRQTTGNNSAASSPSLGRYRHRQRLGRHPGTDSDGIFANSRPARSPSQRRVSTGGDVSDGIDGYRRPSTTNVTIDSGTVITAGEHRAASSPIQTGPADGQRSARQ